MVWSEEARKEAYDRMRMPENYMDPAGGLYYGLKGNIPQLVLKNLTSGLAK